eukprot:CAMPEP_0118936602 /NCGR_PEP_ID=MMETSP1169-20130426/19622_1 /TAXON_ID=36882 /ORGANISM="Pyramimonas obovata, Strain CCMP722" /LENGTH=348 /DNA_ID=CAMNT_0006879911 /DNA_START=163 /DNA_END=1209 /DNA_ORIENTATION=-
MIGQRMYNTDPGPVRRDSEVTNKYADLTNKTAPRCVFGKNTSTRYNSQGLQGSMCSYSFANGRDTAIDHPGPTSYLPNVLPTGKGSFISLLDTSQIPDFKQCGPWHTLSENRYYGKQYAAIPKAVFHSPEPSRYNVAQVFPKIAHRYGLSAPDSKNIACTMHERGISMVEAIQNVGKRLPAPTDYTVEMTKTGQRLGLQNRPTTFSMAERLKNPGLHSLPCISKGHEYEYQCKHSPGPIYDHPIGTINYTNFLAKGHRWASGNRFAEPREIPRARLQDDKGTRERRKLKIRLCASDDYSHRPTSKPFVPVPRFQSPPPGARKIRTAEPKSQLRQSAPSTFSFTIKAEN